MRKPRVQNITSLHEKTVQKAAKKSPLKLVKPAPIKKRPRTSKPLIERVRPDVMAKARELAGGDDTLLLIISSTKIVVMKYPKQFKKSQFRK